MNPYQQSFSDDLLERPEPFEKGVAMQLGLIVLAHSRLDMTLQRYLATLDGAAGAPEGFAARLARLKQVAGGLADAAQREAILAWAAQCDALPLLRGDRVRDHWLPDARSGRLVNLVEGAQPEAYAARDLDAVIAALADLQTALSRLAGA